MLVPWKKGTGERSLVQTQFLCRKTGRTLFMSVSMKVLKIFSPTIG